MVFTSAPVYLDPPNWQQQLNGPQGIGHDNNHPQFPPVPSQPAPMDGGGGGGGVGIASSIRPGSLADRARQAKLPQPEQALKCPRCESTNTKFCYFNNYSLTQPRHFCKTCRRYWTRGGALRTVPVGGGCRRNKRSSKSSSKSPGTSDHHHHHHQRQNSHSSTSSIPLSNTTTNFMTTSDTSLGHIMTPQSQQHPPHQLPFMASLLNFSTDNYGTTTADHLGLNFSGVNHSPSTTQLGTGGFNFHHMGISTSAGSNNILSSTGSNGEQWRLQQAMQQFPFLSGLEPPRGLYSSFQGSNQQAGVIGNMGHDQSQARTPASPVVTRFASVKTEENEAGGGLNLSRQIMGTNNNNQGNDQYWSGNAWTDLSGFTSSTTTSHLL